MQKKHIRDRKKRPLEETIQIDNLKQFGLKTKISEGLTDIDKQTKAAMNILGLPKNLPDLAGISEKNLNESIGLIARSGGMLNMRNPVMQGVGAIGLAYAIKPELVKGFLGSGVGSALVGGASAYMLGGMVGNMLGNSAVLSTAVGAAMGYTAGVAVGVPWLGLAVSGISSFFGGKKKRKQRRKVREKVEAAIRDLRESQRGLEARKDLERAAFQNFLEHVDLATQGLLMGKESIVAQQKRLDEQRDINIGIIAKNTQEINRTSNLKNESIRRETNKLLARQRVQMGARGISDAGSSWYILGDTETMGLKAEQEVYLARKSALEVEELKYRELMNDYGDMAKQLNDYAAGIDLQAKGLESDVKLKKTEFSDSLRAIDIATKRLDREIEELVRTGNKARGDFSFTPFKSDSSKEVDLMERAERKAGALSAMAFGNAIRTTKAGVNPFDALLNYGTFAH